MKNILSTITIIFLIMSVVSKAQDITNTLAPNGNFKVKDSSTDYLNLDQTTGNLSLFRNFILSENSGGLQLGFVFKGYNKFIHTYYGNGTAGLNTFIGMNSGNFTMGGTVTSGSYNTGVGYESLTFNTTGSWNSAFGTFSLSNNTTGYNNSAFGYQSLGSNSTGSNNSAFGVHSLYNNNANENTAFGNNSLYSNTTGVNNTAVGFNALYDNETGWNNTAVGHHSLENNTGNYNTAIGYNAGSSVTTGLNLTLIGIDANPSSPTATDQVTLGNQFVSSLRCNVQTITSLSDARDKKNITDLTLGLDFITKLKPRQFNWDRREWYEGGISDGSKIQETPTAGFIAQEFDEIQKSENAEWLNLVLKDNPDKWEATYGNLLPVIVKAVQELKAEKDEEIAELKIENEKLIERLNKSEEAQLVLIKKLEQIETKEELFKTEFVNHENNKQ
ncbi:MAG: hypothetical protein HND39_12205 [Ignavibacteriota bacterium]|jgi:hypothetical protein|nr:hypothetical protein [Ignavibacteriota bacterium]MCZ7613638.1 tail fiber domain-containing protein [Ignavibacteriaceae bacterium]MEB2297394.1 tail fiber domain-containing protein [Ignavibacteria bacterium]QKJ96979.1 MAG: hypothetical protein HND39_12205 [Ignavibacteriota bacterium]GIK60743.1 MAG: hypothetical protein BroJett017_16330 [Ignavibacteriota bacterium]